MHKFWWFGDSWVYGDELNNPANECFAAIVSNNLNLEYVNLGEKATSIGHLVHTFFQYKDRIDTNDIVLFFLTEKSRSYINGKNLFHGAWEGFDNNLHPHNDQWYRYFHDDEEVQWMLDKNLMLLHAYCPQAKFVNIFSLNHSDYIPSSAWLIPDDGCIAHTVLPYVHKGFILTDHPALLDTEWAEQKTYVKKYFGKGHHPNKQGHSAIAEKITGILNA